MDGTRVSEKEDKMLTYETTHVSFTMVFVAILDTPKSEKASPNTISSLLRIL